MLWRTSNNLNHARYEPCVRILRLPWRRPFATYGSFRSRGWRSVIYVGVGFVLSVTALAARWIPVCRAGRVDPIIALRAE